MKSSNKFILGLLSGIALVGIFSMVSLRSSVTDFVTAERIKGNDDFKTDTRTLPDFENLHISSFYDVILEQGDQKVVVDAESNILPHIITEVHNGTLKIKKERGVRLKPKKTPKIYITVPDLDNIHISGAGEFKTEGVFDTDDLSLSISGASEMDLNLECDKFTADMSGAADVDLKGSAEYFRAQTSGAGEVDARDFITATTEVQISGAGDMKVHATERLGVQISGAGSVRYAGNPKKVDKQVSGMGDISPME